MTVESFAERLIVKVKEYEVASERVGFPNALTYTDLIWILQEILEEDKEKEINIIQDPYNKDRL